VNGAALTLAVLVGIVALRRRWIAAQLRRAAERLARHRERAGRPPLVADLDAASRRIQRAQHQLGGARAKPEPARKESQG